MKNCFRQKCVLSPDIFNLCREKIMRAIEDLDRVIVGGENTNNIRFAVDTELVATSQTELQRLVTKVEEESEKLEIAWNKDKTECFEVAKEDAVHSVTYANSPFFSIYAMQADYDVMLS